MIASDSKGPVGGSVSYIDNEVGKVLNVSLATPVSEKSALGVTYRNHRPIDEMKRTPLILEFLMPSLSFLPLEPYLKTLKELKK